MNQNRKDDREMPNRQSNMEPAEGSRTQERGAGQAREGSTGSSGRHRSVMDDQDAFEHGADTDSIAKGMGSSRERNQGGGITNRSMERERSEQQQLPARGKSQSER